MKFIEAILNSLDINLIELEDKFKVNDINSNERNVRLCIKTKSSITVFLNYLRNGSDFSIRLDHMQDPEVTFEGGKYIGTKNKALDDDVTGIFRNYYILETIGGKDAYLHYLDENKKYLYKVKCTNFPMLLFGKRKLKLYTPLIDTLKEDL